MHSFYTIFHANGRTAPRCRFSCFILLCVVFLASAPDTVKLLFNLWCRHMCSMYCPWNASAVSPSPATHRNDIKQAIRQAIAWIHLPEANDSWLGCRRFRSTWHCHRPRAHSFMPSNGPKLFCEIPNSLTEMATAAPESSNYLSV